MKSSGLGRPREAGVPEPAPPPMGDVLAKSFPHFRKEVLNNKVILAHKLIICKAFFIHVFLSIKTKITLDYPDPLGNRSFPHSVSILF